MSSGTLFTRIPAWLRQALGAQEPDVPNVLGAIVDPVLDVGQGGWGGLTWVARTVDIVGANTTTDIMPADPDVGYLFFAELLMILAGGTAGTARIMMRDPVLNEDIGIFRRSATTTPGFYEHVDLAGHSLPFVVPPGFALRSAIDADDNVANAISLQLAIASYRAGYKPI